MTDILVSIESDVLALVDLVREDVPRDRWIVRAVLDRLMTCGPVAVPVQVEVDEPEPQLA